LAAKNCRRYDPDNATQFERIYRTCQQDRLLKEERMLILLIILLVLALGAYPAWPYSRGWGYYPSGGLGLVLLIVLIVVLFNR
jgi:Protein of unknown function (DUF3309)